MSLHVVVGAGATGTATAQLLAESGVDVRIVSRRGGGPAHPRIEPVAADAADAARLRELTAGAALIVNTAMPAYDRWPTDWPPLAASMLAAAEAAGADYVMLGNVYGYGPVDGPFTEDLPMRPTTVKGGVRAQMWLDALAAHEAGRVRVTEVRANDFLGAGAASVYGFLVVPEVLAGRPAAYPGDLDAPHSWTYVGDVARTLVAAAKDDRSFGRAWHVPATSTLPVRDLTERLAAVAGAPAPVLRAMPVEEVRRLGQSDPIVAELVEMDYLDRLPCLLDSTLTERTFGVTATPLAKVLTELATLP